MFVKKALEERDDLTSLLIFNFFIKLVMCLIVWFMFATLV